MPNSRAVSYSPLAPNATSCHGQVNAASTRGLVPTKWKSYELRKVRNALVLTRVQSFDPKRTALRSIGRLELLAVGGAAESWYVGTATAAWQNGLATVGTCA